MMRENERRENFDLRAEYPKPFRQNLNESLEDFEAYMIACSLGGKIIIILKTKEE